MSKLKTKQLSEFALRPVGEVVRSQVSLVGESSNVFLTNCSGSVLECFFLQKLNSEVESTRKKMLQLKTVKEKLMPYKARCMSMFKSILDMSNAFHISCDSFFFIFSSGIVEKLHWSFLLLLKSSKGSVEQCILL